jgi:hypothetical protein
MYSVALVVFSEIRGTATGLRTPERYIQTFGTQGYKMSSVSKMADVAVPGYKKFWTDKGTTLKAEYQLLVARYPNAEAQLKQLFKILCGIEVMAGHTPASVGQSVE